MPLSPTSRPSRIGRSLSLVLLTLLFSLPAACGRSTLPATGDGPAVGASGETTSPAALIQPPVVTQATPARVETALPVIEPTAEPLPVLPAADVTACGVLLPPLPGRPVPTETSMTADEAAIAELRAWVPAVAWPALERLFDAPDTVGLVAYQAGQAANGVYWNAAAPMPIASVAKVINVIGYAEAIASGALNPAEPVSLAELERYYLPRFDLGAHRRAVSQATLEGRVFGEADPAVTLDDVAWMMTRFSSNAASDYLQSRLGQARIEALVTELGLTNHTAPCPFLGQFLMMANHTRGGVSDVATLAGYADNAATGAADYGRDLASLAQVYSADEIFREEEVAWRSVTRRPTIATQRAYAEEFAPQGTAQGYADLMARLAQNGLQTADSSFQTRRILEWPMQAFPVNLEHFSNLGYKNGSLPGVLATVYYAYRWNDPAPVVVALFYRDLPQQTYRAWRDDLPHDEFARWLLIEPDAIDLLRNVLAP